MTITRLRQDLAAARRDGTVDVGEVDRLMLRARDAGGLSKVEKQELIQAADGFDDASKQRVLSHLAAMDQKAAWVNVDAPGQVANVEGRYATLTSAVPGLAVKVGLLDSAFALKGTATADGVLKLSVEGTSLAVPVKAGQTAAQVLEAVKAKLPAQVTGVVFGGEVQAWEPARFDGAAARAQDTAAQLVLYKPDALGLRPGEKPLRVVVTGYGAFMGITDNPSANLAQKLAQAGVKGAVVQYQRLDVTTQAVDGFMGAMRQHPPDVILSMGVTGGQAQVEERPENHLGAAPDGNDQPMAERQVRPGMPQELKTDLPVDTIEWAASQFKGQRQVFTSKGDPDYAPDRSAYLCNYLGFNLAAEFGKVDATTAGFMHITRETDPRQMHAVLEAIVARQLEWRRGQVGPPVS